MQTLLFNTTTKSIKLYVGFPQKSEILLDLQNVPTVKVLETYYEIMQKDITDRTFPVARFPIQNTNMLIEK